jgi:hypothetical protein
MSGTLKDRNKITHGRNPEKEKHEIQVIVWRYLNYFLYKRFTC